MSFENPGNDAFPDGYGDIPPDPDNIGGELPYDNTEEPDDMYLVSGMGFESERVEPTYIREADDIPDFDVVQFKNEAIARAVEFDGQITRLARFKTSEELADLGVKTKEAAYDLPNGTRVEVLHQKHSGEETKTVAYIKIYQPPVEMMCADGNIRRVTLSRGIIHKTFTKEHRTDFIDDLEIAPDPEMLERLESLWEEIQAHRATASLDPNYRPAELMWARSDALVERKLLRGPNYTTEHHLPVMHAETRTAHEAARRHAGERVDQPAYNIAEHRVVMALLNDIDPKTVKPVRLSPDFHSTWTPPEPPPHAWIPQEPR